jgi:hypothetical protein
MAPSSISVLIWRRIIRWRTQVRTRIEPEMQFLVAR